MLCHRISTVARNVGLLWEQDIVYAFLPLDGAQSPTLGL